jgi:hypothetical protein
MTIKGLDETSPLFRLAREAINAHSIYVTRMHG